MQENQLRAVVQSLQARKDASRRQREGLQLVKSLLENRSNLAPLLPVLIEIATTDETAGDIRREVVDLLTFVVKTRDVYEKCDASGDLLGAFWSVAVSSDEAGAMAALEAIKELPPEVFVKMLHGSGPEAVMRRAIDLRRPTVRPAAITAVGVAIVKAWPFIASGHDEAFKDAVVESLRIVFNRLSNADSGQDVRTAAATVLDVLLVEYLRIEPACFAPVALLHATWRLGTIYGTLLVELMHDIAPALPDLCPNVGGRPLVAQDCPWLAQQAQEPGKARSAVDPSDSSVSLTEAAAFRAALLWILAHAGGLARRHPEASGDRCGSLVFDVIREVALGGHGMPSPAVTEMPPDAKVTAALDLAATGGGSSWLARFCQCRAKIMQVVVELASGRSPNAASLLGTIENTLQVAGSVSGGSGSSDLLQRFAAEVCASLLSVWSLMNLQTANAQLLTRVSSNCARTLLAGVGVASTQAALQPPRLICLLGTTCCVQLSVVVRLRWQHGEGGALGNVFASVSGAGGGKQLSTLILALLCRECHGLLLCNLASGNGALLQATLSVAMDILDLACPFLFTKAARAGTAAAASTSPENAAAIADAACWQLLSLTRCAGQAGGGPAKQTIVQKLTEALFNPEIRSLGGLAVSVASTLIDIGGTQQLPSGVEQTLKNYKTRDSPDLTGYINFVVRGLAEGGHGRQPAEGGFASQLGACGNESALAAVWLHCLSNSAASEGSPKEVPISSISGPPIMVYIRLLPWMEAGKATLRLDVHNATGLTFQNVQLALAIGTSLRQGEAENAAWCFQGGVSKTQEWSIESMPCRTCASLWRELHVRALRPIWVSAVISYDNTSTEPAVGPSPSAESGRAANPGAVADAWSDDEDDDSFRLRFACHPFRLPLAAFFRPFLGFSATAMGHKDNAETCGPVFPPPAIFATCPLSARLEAEAVGIQDPAAWTVPGFRRIPPGQSRRYLQDVLACHAGIAFDGSTIMCLLYRRGGGSGASVVEILCNSDVFLKDFMAEASTWLAR
eukprot:TRINITY_DN66033_c0_g1_i1.p1 TRINITY_DN66033_c0_g1~~TRINITY_DN66033_c0_g1_i1.p1  ORF type:complete len:1022 (+),score=202.50 TRINITY_DN66033_c0_g1_i1:120-3185(+)